MKKPVVLAALICGLLGSSYAGSSYLDDTVEDEYWKSAPYDRGELSAFRSPGRQNQVQKRSFSQSRQLEVPSRFSGSNYTDPDEMESGSAENFVINDQTGKKVTLSQLEESEQSLGNPRVQTSYGTPTAPVRRYPQVMREPQKSPYHQKQVFRNELQGGRDFARGFESGVTPQYAPREEPRVVEPVQENRVYSQGRVQPQQMAQAEQQEVSRQSSMRRPKVRKNTSTPHRVRNRRDAWYTRPFRGVSRFFTRMFRR